MYVRYVPICFPILVYPPNFRDGETEAPVGGRNLMEVSFGGCPMSLFSETVVETLGGSNEPGFLSAVTLGLQHQLGWGKYHSFRCTCIFKRLKNTEFKWRLFSRMHAYVGVFGQIMGYSWGSGSDMKRKGKKWGFHLVPSPAFNPCDITPPWRGHFRRTPETGLTCKRWVVT